MPPTNNYSPTLTVQLLAHVWGYPTTPGSHEGGPLPEPVSRESRKVLDSMLRSVEVYGLDLRLGGEPVAHSFIQGPEWPQHFLIHLVRPEGSS